MKPTWGHLTGEEGEDIGMETVIMVAAARAGRLPSGGRSPITPTVHGLVNAM